MRHTKIVVTLGPATDDPEVLRALIDAGMDVARLNASHAGPAELAVRLEAVRQTSEQVGRPVAVMLDLAGSKLRVGDILEGTRLLAGEQFVLTSAEGVGDLQRAHINYEGLAKDVSIDDRILLDDGRIELVVESTGGGEAVTRVVEGGELSSHKGVNVPGVTLDVEAVTRYDRAMVEWAIAKGVDLVAQSFVRHADDIRSLKTLMRDTPIPVVAKIEKYEAVEGLDEIVQVADAVMIARGDLGVETAVESVPVLQRRILSVSRASGTPVIVATQMLESMTHASRPTRAESSDVANAIFDQVDAVMLSGETAVGDHPALVVETMERIVTAAEGSIHAMPAEAVYRSGGARHDVPEALSAAVCDLAQDLDLAAIITATQSGATARSVARHRPVTPVVAATPSEAVARSLQIAWGVHPVVVPLASDTDEMIESVVTATRDRGLVSPGERVVVTAGVTTRARGATDLILVRTVPE